jgi:hypothetical protein
MASVSLFVRYKCYNDRAASWQNYSCDITLPQESEYLLIQKLQDKHNGADIQLIEYHHR